MTAYPITALQWITQLFLALPMLAIIVNNAIPRERMRHFTISLSATRMRAIAVSRSGPCTISLAIIES